jgi:Serine aminopeptidase, S33
MKIYIGHSDSENEQAERVSRYLKIDGLVISGDVLHLRPTDNVVDKRREALSAADAIVLLFSASLLRESYWDNLLQILEEHVDRVFCTIYLVALDECDIPAFLSQCQRFSYQNLRAEDFKSLRAAINALRPATMIKSAGSSPVAIDHLVILIHGINTHAHWMHDVAAVLKEENFDARPTSFGHYSPWAFLAPYSRPRRKATARVVKAIDDSIDAFTTAHGKPPAKISIIAHSFGTHIFADILQRYRKYTFYRVIFSGSVVREDYDFTEAKTRFKPDLLNEVGTADIWPALAASAGWGYGSVGSEGFKSPYVTTRWHADCTHSSFLTRQFCKQHWVPFLRDEPISIGDNATPMPWYVSLFRYLPLRYLLLVVFLGLPTALLLVVVNHYFHLI